eukprot:g5363.t1
MESNALNVKGTSILIENLFYIYPVRLKFMKSKSEREVSAIKIALQRIALSHPFLSLHFYDASSIRVPLKATGNGRYGHLRFSVHACTLKNQSCKNNALSTIVARFGDFFGREKAMRLCYVSSKRISATNSLSIEGFISKSRFRQSRSALQFFFLNNRPLVKPKWISKVFNETYNRFTKKDSEQSENEIFGNDYISLENAKKGTSRRRQKEFPLVLLYITCDPSEFDISHEPGKNVVSFQKWKKFENAIEEFLSQFFSPKTLNAKNIVSKRQKPLLFSHGGQGANDDLNKENISTHNQFKSNSQNVQNSQRSQNNEWPGFDFDSFNSNGNKIQHVKAFTTNLSIGKKGEEKSKTSELMQAFGVSIANRQFSLDSSSSPRSNKIYKLKDNATHVSTLTEQTISKTMIQIAKPVGHLSRKFILATAKNQSSQLILLCIDQHAAHERVRVERLENELMAHPIPCVKLCPQVSVSITFLQAKLLNRCKSAAKKWNFQYDISSDSKNNLYNVRLITAPNVAGYTLNAADLLEYCNTIDIFSKEKRPPAISRVLASKACRGALMFGDPLSHDEMRLLLNQLASTNFPFQCAHGRPSMVPLLDLQSCLNGSRSREKALATVKRIKRRNRRKSKSK